MKAITIFQPQASLIAVRAKPFETRTWAPPAALIGQRLAIHAAMGAGGAPLEDWQRAAAEAALSMPAAKWHTLPHGAVICTALLRGAHQVQRCRHSEMDVEFRASVPGSENMVAFTGTGLEFGDFRQSRWCWHLTDVEHISSPAATRGYQGLWNWEPAA